MRVMLPDEEVFNFDFYLWVSRPRFSLQTVKKNRYLFETKLIQENMHLWKVIPTCIGSVIRAKTFFFFFCFTGVELLVKLRFYI